MTFKAMTEMADQAKGFGVWIAIIGALAGGLGYLTSFAKADQVSKSFDAVNVKVDIEHDRISTIGSRMDVHEALLRHIDQDMHELLKQRRGR